MSEVKDKIREQVEYYLSDKNLSGDKFFHNEISKDTDGWLPVEFILNCNKIKALTDQGEEVIAAIKDSSEVESDDKGFKLRRKDNKELPKLVEKVRRRDAKAERKEEDDGELKEKHFKAPKILQFEIDKADAKPNWRDMENDLVKAYPDLRILYSRSDEIKTGHLAICSVGLDQEILDKLMKDGVESEGQKFTYTECVGEVNKKFWDEHGSHYQMCAG